MGASITTTFPSVLQVPSAIFQKGTQVSRGGKPERFSLEGRWRASATPRSTLPAAFARPLSRCDPCSFRPPLLHCCCADDPASLAYPCIDR